MNIENPSLQKGIELTEELCDIQADYIARLVELFSIIEQEGPTREFEMTSRGLTEEDISILRSIPASCLRDLPIAFEIDTGPLKKLNKFIEDNGGYASKLGILLNHARKHPFGYDFKSSGRRCFRLTLNAVANGFAHIFVQLPS